MGDSAFRRLLLDTVATVISQPPSTSSLIELLRIATPGLLASSSNTKQLKGAESTVRNVSKREKLFRTLQLRIHPDKHDGDERATVLFQEVTVFYDKCVDAMKIEDERRRLQRQRQPYGDSKTADVTTSTKNDEGCNGYREDDDEEKGGSRSEQFPQWYPWWYRLYQNTEKNTTNPQTRRSHTNNGATTHSDYESYEYNHHEQYPRGSRTDPMRDRNNSSAAIRNRRQPSTHQAFAVLSTILFPPLGICALLHSFLVKRAWKDGRYGDARDHSDQAYSYAWFGCLCFAFVFMYLWLSDGDVGWDWERMKHNLPWSDGP